MVDKNRTSNTASAKVGDVSRQATMRLRTLFKSINVFLLENLNFWIIDFKGEIAALGAAILWAISSIIYSRLGQRIQPLKLNLVKGAIAITLLGLTLLVRGELFPAMTTINLCLLLLILCLSYILS